MSDSRAEFEAGGLLGAMGQVQPPASRVLEGAREMLWSAVASEMLGTSPAGEQAATAGGSAGAEEGPETARRRQPGRSRDT